MSDEELTPWYVMLLRYLAGLAVVSAAGWANLALVDRWLTVFGIDLQQLELSAIVVPIGALLVSVAGAGVWTLMWWFRRAGDGAKQGWLLVTSVVTIFIVGFLVTGWLGSRG
jgi:hypothetical protein